MFSNPIDAIKKRRQNLGVSQWTLSKAVGRTQAWLSIRESGHVYLTPNETRALEYALDRIERGE